MRAGILIHLVATFGMLSLLSVGGANATLPEIHRQVVNELHWLDDPTFASLVAIAQTAPGPNVLVVSIIGWQLAGVAGLVLSTAAMVVPSSSLALVIGRVMARHESNRFVVITRRALAPVAVGLMLASGAVMSQAAYHGPLTLVLVAAMTGLILFTTMSPLWGIAGGALAGIIGHHLHAF